MGTPKVQVLGLGGYTRQEADNKFAKKTDLDAVREEINGVEEELQMINEGGVE